MTRERTRIVFLGSSGFFRTGPGRSIVRDLGLESVVEVSRRIPNRDALVRLRRASCLLILQASDDTRSLIPAKAFEYLRVERPILALTPEGATSDLLKDMDGCSVVDPSDGQGLQDALRSLYRAWEEGPGPRLFTRNIRKFERSSLTEDLAQTLRELPDRQSHG
jgi:glycosyltransferase involved in cell wall biosynthesis